MSDRSPQPDEQAQAQTSNKPAQQPRWFNQAPQPSNVRVRRLAITSCLLASLAGALIAFASLPVNQPETVLVALYLAGDEQTVGTDGPHNPASDLFMGLRPINMPTIADPLVSAVSNGSNPSVSAAQGSTPSTGGVSTNGDDDKGTSTSSAQTASDSSPPTKDRTIASESMTTGWREAIVNVSRRQQLVLHVSSMASIGHGQVYLTGRDPWTSAETMVSFTDLLSQLKKSRAANVLLVLDIHWPHVDDVDDPSQRLTQLNEAIDDQLRRSEAANIHVLLSSDGTGVARGLPDAPQSQLSYWLTASLATSDADANDDGRIAIEEAVRWAKPRIRAASSDRAKPQVIRYVAAANASTFLFPSQTLQAARVQRDYPDWLASAWDLRSAYLNDPEMPWLTEVSQAWGAALSQIESSWRRGEDEVLLHRELVQRTQPCIDAIRQAFAEQQQQRSDSLRFAADRFDGKNFQNEADLAAQALLIEHAEALRTLPVEAQTPAIAKAIDAYVAKFLAAKSGGTEAAVDAAAGQSNGDRGAPNSPDPQQAATIAIATLLNQLDRNVHADRNLILLVDQVRRQFKNAPSFPVTQAIEWLLKNDADTQTINGALQLFRLQERVGCHPEAVAILQPLIAEASHRMIVAQRLVWNPGMTSRQQVSDQVNAAIVAGSAAWMAERAIALALRRLRIVSEIIATDEAVGLQWIHDRDYIEAQRRAGELIRAVEQTRRCVEEGQRIMTSELAVVRQASEALDRQWRKVVVNRAAALSSLERLPTAPLSTSIAAEDRSRLLSQSFVIDPSLMAVAAARQSSMESLPMLESDPSEELVCLIGLSQQVDAVTKGYRGNYRDWLLNYFSQAATIEALSDYQKAAEAMSIGTASRLIPVGIDGDLQGLDWNTPAKQIQLHYQVDLPEASPVSFEFLPPASTNLTVYPSQGTLTPDQRTTVTMDLQNRSGIEQKTAITGLWLRLTCGNQRQLVRLPIPAVQSSPAIEIDFGDAAIATGRAVVLKRWPDCQAVPIDWRLICNDPTIKNVTVTIRDATGGTRQSAPIACIVGEPADIRLLPAPPAKPLPTDATKNGKLAGSTAASSGLQGTDLAGTLSGLNGTLSIDVHQVEGEILLGTWSVQTQLLDPQQAILPEHAEFVTSADGSNRLTATFQSSSDPALQGLPPFQPTLRLELDSQTSERLIDFGESRLQVAFDRSAHSAELFANNLRFQEGGQPLVPIPVSVNGDRGYFEWIGRFPLQPGRVQLRWQRTPSITLVAADSIVPGEPLPMTIKARCLADSDRLLIEVMQANDRSEHVLWRRTLETSRSLQSTFLDGGQTSTWQIVAARQDWQIDVPTDFGTGDYRIRVSTQQPVGNRKVIGEHRFLLDGAVPTDIQAYAEATDEQTTVRIQMTPTPSGTAAVVVEPAIAVTEKKTQPIAAQTSSDDGSSWQLTWPKAIPLPERVTVHVTTRAGQQSENTIDLPVQKVASIGTIEGHVYEGSIAQPGLTVALTDATGKPIAAIGTDDTGAFSFNIPPGDYRLSVQKSSTQRSATASANVRVRTTTVTDLMLAKASS